MMRLTAFQADSALHKYHGRTAGSARKHLALTPLEGANQRRTIELSFLLNAALIFVR